MFRRPYLNSRLIKTGCVSASLIAACADASAYQFQPIGGWNFSLDTSVQWTGGWRTHGRDDNIGNGPFYAEGDYKFNPGDMVTNRLQGLVELNGIYQGNSGFRISGSAWKDFAYSDTVFTNPAPAFQSITTYPGGHYSADTRRFTLQGAQLLDAFVFKNTSIGNIPVYAKLGRLVQTWGNSFFFGFSNIAYSQNAIDYQTAFAQPGTELKELYLPRGQALITTELSPTLAVTGQYIFEFTPNRYPEGGTYLGPSDFLYAGPRSGGALAGVAGGPVTAGNDDRPKNINGNFGVKVAWSPEWAGGDMGFYFRQFDEVHPWSLLNLNAAGGGDVHLSYAQKVKLLGFSYERSIGNVSVGLETSYRKDTALNSALTNGIAGVPTTQGATGDIYNVIANALVTLGKSPLYDTGSLIAELSYTHLLSVTSNPQLYNGVGYAACPSNNKWAGCSTKDALAVAFLFEPQWLQVFSGVDLSMPMSYTFGVTGNPAYAAGGFYAQGTSIYSIGLKATYKGNSSLTLQYNGYHWHAGSPTTIPGLGSSYAVTNGPAALNDKGWVELTFKSSF